MQGSSWSYVPQGFPARSIRNVAMEFVDSLTVPTWDVQISRNPAKRLMSLRVSKVFTCPQGGFTLPQEWQVQRPILTSCLNGTPMMISCLATLFISLHARCISGTCSSTSAQKMQSNELGGKSSFVTSPATATTRGITKVGL